MSLADQLRPRLTQWSETVHDKATVEVQGAVSDNSPEVTGRLKSALRRSPSRIAGTRVIARLEQTAGPGEPEPLPNWLDEGTTFVIRPVRAKALAFEVSGAGLVFANRVNWRPRQSSVGFWSRHVNEAAWRAALQDGAASTPLPR